MLKIYGIPVSRASRNLWICRELGLDFEHVPVGFLDGGTQQPEFLQVNRAGKVPAIDDEGFRLSESMAINIYLAKKHGSELMPKDLHGEAQVLQWSFWVMTEVEKALLTVLMQRLDQAPDTELTRFFRERNPKNPDVERAAIEALQRPLSYLDAHLTGRDYLLGASFTLADLNVASVMAWALGAKLDLAAYPNVQQWLSRCMARPAAKANKA